MGVGKLREKTRVQRKTKKKQRKERQGKKSGRENREERGLLEVVLSFSAVDEVSKLIVLGSIIC